MARVEFTERAVQSTERGGTTRLRILEAGAQAFAEHGFAGTSLNDVIKAAGVTKRTLYYHFASKDDLIAPISRNVICRPWAVTRA